MRPQDHVLQCRAILAATRLQPPRSFAATLRLDDFPRDWDPSSRAKIALPQGPPLGCGPRMQQTGRFPLHTYKDAIGAALNPERNVMSTIGTFTKNGDGYNGTLQTLAFNVKAKIVTTPKDGENGPDFRVTVGGLEIGAGWKRQSANSKEYVSVKLDDPTFPAPVNARLIETENGSAVLYWTRRTAD